MGALVSLVAVAILALLAVTVTMSAIVRISLRYISVLL